MKRLILMAICLLLAENLVFAEEDINRYPIVDSEPILSEITAYAPYDNKSGICGGGVTSRGYRPNRHYAAVDPSVIPYGTRIYVPGYGEVIAADTGGAIKGYKIDLYFDTYEEAIQWGRKEVRVVLRHIGLYTEVMIY